MLPQNSASNCILLTLVQHHWLSVNRLYACGLFFHFFFLFFSAAICLTLDIQSLTFRLISFNFITTLNVLPIFSPPFQQSHVLLHSSMITFCKLLHLMPKDLTLFKTNNICHPSPLSPQKG